MAIIRLDETLRVALDKISKPWIEEVNKIADSVNKLERSVNNTVLGRSNACRMDDVQESSEKRPRLEDMEKKHLESPRS